MSRHKVLVVGAFAMFTGSNFALPHGASGFESSLPFWLTGKMTSAVQAWMVVAIVGREFLVSAVRGYSESCGVKFPATPAGKIKMFVQSVAICIVLYQLANFTPPSAARTPIWTVITKLSAVWAAVIVTVLSGLVYISKARKLLLTDEQD